MGAYAIGVDVGSRWLHVVALDASGAVAARNRGCVLVYQRKSVRSDERADRMGTLVRSRRLSGDSAARVGQRASQGLDHPGTLLLRWSLVRRVQPEGRIGTSRKCVEHAQEAFRAYYRFVPKGSFALEYTMRVNTPGSFEMPPTRVEAMYSPELFGESPNAKVVVKE